MRIPPALAEHWRHEPTWLAALPRLAAECAESWGLELEEPVETPRSLIVPAGDAVLKLNAPSHGEAAQEAEALARWAGAGAVRLLARDDTRGALLVERCRPGTQLWDSPARELEVVMGLLPRLWLEPASPHPFGLLADESQRWQSDVARRYESAGRPFERRLLDFALQIFQSADGDAGFLVNQDLHGGNILEAEREPWLVIDPKPLVGERELTAVGLLRNAATRGEYSAAPVRRWLDALADAGLDRDRLRGWGVAHALAWGFDEEGRWSPQSVATARAILAAAAAA